MKKQFSLRELCLFLFLLALVIGIAYRSAFYLPLQAEMAAIAAQSQALDAQIIQAAEKAASMDAMQAELDDIFTRPSSEIQEIAAYDNEAQVLAQLHRILQASEEYSLQFSEPAIAEDGTVRRVVTMGFRCSDFSAAKSIVQDFSQSPWRCLIGNLAISAPGDILNGPVQVSATVTFLESTKLP